MFDYQIRERERIGNNSIDKSFFSFEGFRDFFIEQTMV